MQPRSIALPFLALVATVTACSVGSTPPATGNGLGTSPAQVASPAPAEPLPSPHAFPAESGGPRLVFSDLESGPVAGGEDGQGVLDRPSGPGNGGQHPEAPASGTRV